MNTSAPDLEPLSGLDGAFLSLETPATPMHVGSLNLFELPAGYSGDWLADVTAWLAKRLRPVLHRQLVTLPLQVAYPVWQMGEIDLRQHVQHAQVPAPGGHAQLEDLVAQLHAQPLDRSRPLWQVTVLDGLANGQKALYFKIHHAMVDGQAAAALAASLFDTAPSDWATAPAIAPLPTVPTVPPVSPESPESPESGSSHATQPNSPRRPDWLRLLKVAGRHDANQLARLARGLPAALGSLRGLARGVASGKLQPVRLTLAPRTVLNGTITAERGFATLSLPLAEVKDIARACHVSANDVVLTACGGALRRYLARLGPLPDASLIALMALSLRQRGNTEFHNQATLSLISLATNIAHPLQRLQAVHGHTRATKMLAQQAKPLMPTDFPSIGQPWLVGALAAMVERAGGLKRLPPLANVLISSVTGPPQPLYLGPARMTDYWPISIVEHGVGLNMTVVRYSDQLFIGLTVARSAVPDARLLADDLTRAYGELKAAVLVASANTAHD